MSDTHSRGFGRQKDRETSLSSACAETSAASSRRNNGGVCGKKAVLKRMAPTSVSKRAQSPSPTKKGMQSPTTGTSSDTTNRVGSVKLKKVERKAKEQLMATLQELSNRIGKLEDRDTQQQAFQSLM